MAGKSCLLLLGLVTMSALASAHRPLLINKQEALERSIPIPQKMEPKDTVKIIGSKKETDDIGNKMVQTHQGEEKFGNMGNRMVEGGRNIKITDGDGKMDPVTKPNNLGIGLITIPGTPLPGADGSFHFQLGPIGFGFGMGGGLQLGGSYPGQPMPYSQPYVVVSPHSLPYGWPMQYPYITPNQHIGPGFDPPHRRSYDPTPSQGGNAQSSFQKGSFGSPGTNN